MRSEAIYVGGFLCLYRDFADTGVLYIPKSTVQNALVSGFARLPLNINHNDSAVVGFVIGLFDLEHGLFCLAKIGSMRFLEIIRKTAPKSKLITKGPVDILPSDPVVECLSSVFPGLSLSSRADVNSPITEESPFFIHVSICGVGQRAGTIGVFGRDLSWILDQFQSVTEVERTHVLKNVRDFEDFDETLFDFNLYDLLADSLDTSYIKERFSKLKLDKRFSGVSDTTYIKASKSPDENTSSETDNGVSVVDRPFCDKALGVEENGVKMAQNNSVTGASVPTNVSDCIYLPKDAFVSLINATTGMHVKPTIPQTPRQPNSVMFTEQPHSLPSPLPPLEQFYAGFGAPKPVYVSDQSFVPGYYYPAPVPTPACFDVRNYAKSFKRRYTQNDSDEEISFPGDPDYVVHKRGKRRGRREDDEARDTTQRDGTADYRDLMDAIGSLRREITALKQIKETTSQVQVPVPDTNVSITEKPTEVSVKPVINASYTPTQDTQLHRRENSNALLNMNRKLFVEALNKIEN